MQLGANAVITLYFIDGDRVRDPYTPELALAPPRTTVADDGGRCREPAAQGVAQLARFASGSCRSADFSRAGLAAINWPGVTQLRLRMTAPAGLPPACLMLAGGARARLYVTLASTADGTSSS